MRLVRNLDTRHRDEATRSVRYSYNFRTRWSGCDVWCVTIQLTGQAPGERSTTLLVHVLSATLITVLCIVRGIQYWELTNATHQAG